MTSLIDKYDKVLFFPLHCQMVFLFFYPVGFLFSRQVCYDHLGCFSNARPYNNAKGHLPESPDHIQTKFLLYTRQNPAHAQMLNPYDRSTVSGSNFDGHKDTVFITHGYQDDGHAPWIQKMTAAFLKKVWPLLLIV